MKFIVDILKFFTQIIPLLVELLESEKHRKEREAKQRRRSYKKTILIIFLLLIVRIILLYIYANYGYY